MTWHLIAAFLSGFAWSGLDIARKTLAREIRAPVVAAGLSLGLTLLFGGWTLLSPTILRPSSYFPPAAVSIALGLAIHVLILESVRQAELSRTIPLLSMTPVTTALFGVAVLGEYPTLRQWAGIAIVFVGAAGLGLARGSPGWSSSVPVHFRFDRGSWIMLAAALCISAAAPFDKLAIAASSPALHGFLMSTFSAVALILYLGWRGGLDRVGSSLRRRPLMVGAAWLTFAAIGFQFVAYQSIMVGEVETIKRVVGLASSVAAGRLIFGEAITLKKLVTVALMAIGVILLLS